MREPERNLPLECGTAMHQALAIAMCTRIVGGGHSNLAVQRAKAIIGNEDRWYARGDYAVGDRAIDEYVTNAMPEEAALATLYTSSYYDDPSDKKRTIANMEASLLYALQVIEHVPEVINNRVCVEMPIKFVFEYNDKVYAYTGRCDMIVKTPNGVGPLDWKTSTGIAGAWEGQWHLSHQMTGYCAGEALELGVPINDGYVVGIQIPLAKETYKSVRDIHFYRHEHQFESWINFVLDGIDLYERFKDDPHSATKRTDYCFRYFRMCSFADLCSAHPDDVAGYKEELVHVEWNPEDE